MNEAGSGYSLPSFVVFSDDWGIHPSSCQHLFQRISRKHKVTWINTVGMRGPRLSKSDFAKIRSKLGRMISSSAHSELPDRHDREFVVLQPPMLPFADKWSRRINRRVLRNVLESVSNVMPDHVIVSTVPNACDFVDILPGSPVIYYCVDDFSEWPGLDRNRMLEMEQLLIEKSDGFIATSTELSTRLSAYGKPTLLLTHGVDLDHFSKVADCESPVFQQIPYPRIGYFGLFDGRSDQELLMDVARAMPDVSIVIAGNTEGSIERLLKAENVHFVGPIPYADLPQLIKGLNALILPYKVDKLSRALSPLKLKEYLATGLPVLSTPIAAALELEEYLCIGSSVREWCDFINHIPKDFPERRNELIRQFLKRESWSQKATQFVSFCLRTTAR